jgi:hypothetical protein
MTSDELDAARTQLTTDLSNLITQGIPIGLTFSLLQDYAHPSCQGFGCPSCHNTGFNLLPPTQP